MNSLSKVFLGVALAIIVTGCAQFTTSDAELANLKSVADSRAEEYIGCLKSEASTVSGSTDYAFVAKAVSSRCKASLDTYSAAQKEYLGAQYMLTKEPLGESVAALQERGEAAIAEILVNREQDPAPVAAPPPRQSLGLSLPSASVAAASAAAVGAATAWNPEQRVYLDCMDEQADKYVRLNESAESIATVAATKCKSYLTVERRAALEQEGKAKVMAKVMDTRLSPR